MRVFKKIFTPFTLIYIFYILWSAIEIAVLTSGAVLSMNSKGRSYSIIESRKWIYLLQDVIGIILYISFTLDIWRIFFVKHKSVKDLGYRILRNIALLIPMYLMVLIAVYFILPAFGQPFIGGYLNYTEPAIVMVKIGILSIIMAFFIKRVKHK